MTDSVVGCQGPLCSVCIPNYNGMGVIEACLESVMKQEGGLGVEVIVHDDASTDGSANWIAEHYPQVRLLRSDANVGFCVANNRMAEVAQGEYLLLLNNDAALFPDALATLAAASRKQPENAVLGLPQYDAATGELIDRGSFLDPFFNPVPNRLPGDRAVAMVIGACLWMPIRLWHQLGGFPDWLHTLAEDMYLCQAARLAGYPVMVLDRSGFRHWVGHSLGGGKLSGGKLTTTYRRRAASERNKASVLFLCAPPFAAAVLFPLLIASLLLEGGTVSLIKREWRIFRDIYWQALCNLWLWRHILVTERRRVQSFRKIGLGEFLSVVLLAPYKLKMVLRHGMPEIR